MRSILTPVVFLLIWSCQERAALTPAVVEDNGWTPLHEAAIQGDLARVRTLCTQGAAINALARYDLTPLHWAAIKGHQDVVGLLLERGADFEAPNIWGMTPLHEAANIGVARRLVKAGARINARDRQGRTPLHFAKTGDIARLLIDNGADIVAASKDGQKPVQMTAMQNPGDLRVFAFGPSMLRLRGEQSQASIGLQNMSEQPIHQLQFRTTLQPDVADVSIQPPGLFVLHPGQLVMLTLRLERRPNAEIGEQTLVTQITERQPTTDGRDLDLVRLTMALDNDPGLTPQDRGMIRVGKIDLHPEPALWRQILFAAAPLLILVLGAWLLRLRRRNSK